MFTVTGNHDYTSHGSGNGGINLKVPSTNDRDKAFINTDTP